MAKFAKRPTNDHDQELLAQGLKRIQVLAEYHAHDTGKKDEDGNPIYTFGAVHRQKIVKVEDSGFKPARRSSQARQPKQGTKLDMAIEICKEFDFDKDKVLSAIVDRFQTTRGNASIYFKKAQERS